ncbi:Hpt domain-containing protein [Stenotrophomonas sp. SY1]|uniref:Hpt domain-containing protein n=1 Tax=Stenotrophomonas sp. SY1 TaxID=477235 RepID=UPI001E3612A0|nr:Hpt domain-containing protein [Stenotrophomonas sp. SY1]MCD9086088.1 Hpt domain-containing protein [Stenotrophomonas sp. SY1]
MVIETRQHHRASRLAGMLLVGALATSVQLPVSACPHGLLGQGQIVTTPVPRGGDLHPTARPSSPAGHASPLAAPSFKQAPSRLHAGSAPTTAGVPGIFLIGASIPLLSVGLSMLAAFGRFRSHVDSRRIAPSNAAPVPARQREPDDTLGPPLHRAQQVPAGSDESPSSEPCRYATSGTDIELADTMHVADGMRDVFLDTMRSDQLRLSSAIQMAQLELVQQLVHRIRGALVMASCPGLVRAAQAAEEAIDEDPASNASPLASVHFLVRLDLALTQLEAQAMTSPIPPVGIPHEHDCRHRR